MTGSSCSNQNLKFISLAGRACAVEPLFCQFIHFLNFNVALLINTSGYQSWSVNEKHTLPLQGSRPSDCPSPQQLTSLLSSSRNSVDAVINKLYLLLKTY